MVAVCPLKITVQRCSSLRNRASRLLVMGQNEEWASDWSRRIGENVRRLRKHRALSAQQLSDRCAELGYVVPRSTIANLESGRRTTVPVQEVAVLAAALEVPPMAVLFPVVEPNDTLEVLPGVNVLGVEGAWWFGYGQILRDTAKFPTWERWAASGDSQFNALESDDIFRLRVIEEMDLSDLLRIIDEWERGPEVRRPVSRTRGRLASVASPSEDATKSRIAAEKQRLWEGVVSGARDLEATRSLIEKIGATPRPLPAEKDMIYRRALADAS